jgi:hypothetical protein
MTWRWRGATVAASIDGVIAAIDYPPHVSVGRADNAKY